MQSSSPELSRPLVALQTADPVLARGASAAASKLRASASRRGFQGPEKAANSDPVQDGHGKRIEGRDREGAPFQLFLSALVWSP